MKRITALTLTLVMLCTVFTCFVNAGSDYIIPNPPITVEITSPRVDGNITGDEGWSSPAYMNEDTLNMLGTDRSSILGELRFAVDADGFYFSGDFNLGILSYDPSFDDRKDSAEVVMSGIKEDGRCDFSGDSFQLTIDPLCALFELSTDYYYYLPKYTLSLCTDGKIYMYDRDGMYYESVKPITEAGALAEGKLTEDGWCFEAWIPWSMIVAEVGELSGGKLSLNTKDIAKHNSGIKVGGSYTDRYPDLDYAVYTTTPAVFKSGNPGYTASTVELDTLGIDITVSNTCRTNGEHDWSEWIRVKNPTYTEKGKEISLCNICGTTTYREVDKLAVRFNFSDVRYGSWYYDSVLYCVKKGYMNGMSSTRFSPNTALTREQCVLILANIMEVNTETYKNTETRFTDVPTGKWYSGAVAWATEKGYVNGITKDRFGTGMNIQRVAFARLLYSVAQDLGMDMTPRADMSGYVDRKSIPDWAYEQISWAVANNIITSTKDDALVASPYTQLTRAQCATMLWKLGLILDQ